MEQACLTAKTGRSIQRRHSLADCGKTISAQQNITGLFTSRSLIPLSAERQLARYDTDDMSLVIENRYYPTSDAATAFGAVEKIHPAI